MVESKKYKLNKKDGMKILKGAGLAAGGAIATYLLSVLNMVDLGSQGVYLIPILSVALNSIVKVCSGKK